MGPFDAGTAQGPRRVPRQHIVLRAFSLAARAGGRAGSGGWVFRGTRCRYTGVQKRNHTALPAVLSAILFPCSPVCSWVCARRWEGAASRRGSFGGCCSSRYLDATLLSRAFVGAVRELPDDVDVWRLDVSRLAGVARGPSVHYPYTSYTCFMPSKITAPLIGPLSSTVFSRFLLPF